MALVALSLALVVTGCGRQVGETAAPTPADFEGIVETLIRAGIHVTDLVSGDPGCADRTLVGPAISARLSGLDQATPVRIHFYLFRDRAAYERRRGDVDACLQTFIANSAAVEAVDASPYIAAGEGPWATRFRDALREALIASSHIAAPSGSAQAGRLPPSGYFTGPAATT